MLEFINDLPPHVAGIHAFDVVSSTEYENVIGVLLDLQVKRSGAINLLLVIETDIKKLASGLWCGNIQLGLKYFFKWNKVAVVTDQQQIPGYRDLFKYIIPGEFKNYSLDKLDEAVRWVSGK